MFIQTSATIKERFKNNGSFYLIFFIVPKSNPYRKILKNCKNCNTEFTGEFCSGCGLPQELKRIDRQYIAGEIGRLIKFDKGLLYTVKELCIRPGDTVREFILEDRRRLVKPITFLIICSIIYNISQQFLSFEAGYIKFDVNDHIMGKMYGWLSKNYGYTNILMAIFITLWTKIFFKKYNYNHYEIYILLCFIVGISILFYTLLGIIESIIDFPLLQLGLIFGITYCTWAIGQFFDRKKKLSYLKGFLSYIFGIISSFIIFLLIGVLLETLIY